MAAGRLSSYRFRRRMFWAGIWAAVVITAVTVGAIFWNTAGYKETFSNEPAQTYVPAKKIRLTADDRREISAIAKKFVATAVARVHPEEAYELVGPALKGGLTRDEWKGGTIPVVYYPVDFAKWKLEYATDQEVGLSVLLLPKVGETVRPTVFNMALAPRAPGDWLITAWSPKGGSPDIVRSRSSSPSEAIAAITDPRRYSRRASTAWLLLPVGFVLIALSVPVVLFTRDRLAMRRVRRQFGRR